MTNKLRTVPAHDWLLNLQEHEASSETEAMMIHDDNWKPRDESLWDRVDEVLDDDEKAVVELVVLGGWSYRQIATELGMSVGRAHNLKVRAFKKLEVALKGKFEDG